MEKNDKSDKNLIFLAFFQRIQIYLFLFLV